MKLSHYLSPSAVAQLIGVSPTSFHYYLKNPDKHPYVERLIESFLDGDAKKLNEIQLAFRDGSKNRMELHKMRLEIFRKRNINPLKMWQGSGKNIRKAKVHPTVNQCEPSEQ